MAPQLGVLSVLAVLGVATQLAASMPVSSKTFNHTRPTRVPKPRIYVNQWAVEIHEGEDVARAVAAETDFVYLAPIGSLENFYIFRHPQQEKASSTYAEDKTSSLLAHEKVHWAKQQVKRRMKKKQAVTRGTPYLLPVDAFYYRQWYYNKAFEDPKPVWNRGFTGRGVKLVLIDDGVAYRHPDLIANYDSSISYDYVDFDTDPDPTNETILHGDPNTHGTRCAGEIVATANGVCIAGVAYNATYGAIRLIHDDFTDATEAAATSHNVTLVSIYSNSWGPSDDGDDYAGPDPLARAAYQTGATQGRNGLGSIYVTVAGNGRYDEDNCAADGYVNLINTIAVTAADHTDEPAWYAEHCSAVMVTSYSSGEDYMPGVATTDLNNGCTDHHGGTSAAVPKVSGVISLALQANLNMTWRDVHHLIALTSRHDDHAYNVDANAAGFLHTNAFGFGMINTAGMVNLAQHWTNVGAQRICTSNYLSVGHSATYASATHTIPMTCAGGDKIDHLEHVAITVSAENYWSRGYIQLELVSPSGTVSRILDGRYYDYNEVEIYDWQFKSVAFWGEPAAGNWVLRYASTVSTYQTVLIEVKLDLYGTEKAPAITSLPQDSDCHTQCDGGCVGLLDTDCDKCLTFTQFLPNGLFRCVAQCPTGYTQEGARCVPCPPTGLCPSLITLPSRIPPTGTPPATTLSAAATSASMTPASMTPAPTATPTTASLTNQAGMEASSSSGDPAASPTATSISSATTKSAENTPGATDRSTSGLSGGGIAGVVVGSLAGVLILIMGVAMVLRSHKNRPAPADGQSYGQMKNDE